MRKIILVLVSLLWLGFWWWWYTCKISGSCLGSKSEITTPPSIDQDSGALLFNLNDSNTLVQSHWPFYRDSLINNLNKNQLLEIEGQYLAEEPNNTIYENMGIARANAIKLLFPDSLQNRILLTSIQVAKRPAMALPFKAFSINIKDGSENIEQTNDKTLIYFKYNSDQRIQEKDIEKYLTALAAQHKDSRASIHISGHTDNTGDAGSNLNLGLHRANAIKKFLTARGINPHRIQTKSFGETLPLADNNSAEGRQKNRRIEIEIIQKQ